MPDYSIWIIASSILTSFFAVQWIYFKVLKIAKVKNLVDNPDGRKLQKSPVPVVGGIAVFFGIVFGLLASMAVYYAIHRDMPAYTAGVAANELLSLILAMVVMLYTGTMDDILGLTPKARFVIEILTILGIVFVTGGCIDSFHGLWGIDAISWYYAVPLTVLTGVGIINSVNMIDGVNGLSSGLCMICCLIFGFAFFSVGDIANAVLAFTMVSSLFPFFIHNVFGDTSRMFIGDAGTMFMGMLMTWFVISAMRSDTHFASYENSYSIIAIVLSILSVPVADTLRVMTMRILHGRSPFSPDKTHLHHAFVSMGVSHSITSLSEIMINITVVAIWYLSARLGAPLHCQLYTVILFAAILVWGTYYFLEHEKFSNSRMAKWMRNFSPKTHLASKEWWQRLTYRLDAPEFSLKERKNLRERLDRKFRN